VTLAAAKRAAAFFHTPARSLTIAQAIAEMRGYARSGLVDILSEGSGSSPRMVIGGDIAGVQHFYDVGNVKRNTIDNLDPRFGVFLVRLDHLLHSLGVREVDALGITHGGDNPGDAHNQGRAIDISGVRGRSLFGGTIDLNVLRDWGKKPASAIGTYRLHRSDPGYAMFKAIYQFATIEGQDRSERPVQGGPPSSIGFASYILTPDHPVKSLRIGHQDHLHLQVGPTNV
jgi:hypothetical protein